MQDCIADIREWMSERELRINDGKTMFILIGTRAQLTKIKTDHIVVGGVNVKKVSYVRNLGVWFEDTL